MRVLSGNNPLPADTLPFALKHGKHNVGTIAVIPKQKSDCFPEFKAAKELVKSGWFPLFSNKQRVEGMKEKKESWDRKE